LGVRKDHIDEHDRKLVREAFIRIVKDENGGRVVCLLAPWQPRAQRNGQPAQNPAKKTTSQDLGKAVGAQSQNLGSPLDSPSGTGESTQNAGADLKGFPNVGKPLPQNLGKSPQVLGKSPQVLGKSPQVLGSHIRNNQPMNQPMEPAQGDTLGAGAPGQCADQPEGEISKLGGTKSARRKADPPKSRFHNHPAVVAYRETLGFFALNAAQADLIAEATGEEVERAPPEWRKFLRELAETGNKHAHNVRVMVLAFVRYRAGVPLAEALRAAWDDAQGRTNEGISDGRNDAVKTRDARTTEEFGIRSPRRL
jgi:hypothetical protein